MRLLPRGSGVVRGCSQGLPLDARWRVAACDDGTRGASSSCARARALSHTRLHAPSPSTTGGCGAKFDIFVVSDALPPSILERHRLVQRILKDELAGVHATTIKTLTVAQAAARRAAGTL